MSAHALPQTFVAEIENDPERRWAAIATIQFVHVTTFEKSYPDAEGQAVRHAEESLQRDIYWTDDHHRQLYMIEMDLLKESYEPGAHHRIRKAFEKIRALKMPDLPEAKRNHVSAPVRLLRFITWTLLSTHPPGKEEREGVVELRIVPVRDKMS